MESPPPVLQKILAPVAVEMAFERGCPLVSGPVIPFDATTAAWSLPEILSAFSIDGEWRIFPADISHVYMLRMPNTSQLHLHRPEHYGATPPWPTFTSGHLDPPYEDVPVWALSPTYMPPSSEIWRVDEAGTQTHVATFAGLATGWVAAPGSEFPDPAPYWAPEDNVGPRAYVPRCVLRAEVNSDETVTLLNPSPDEQELADGFTEAAHGWYTLTVPPTECEMVAVFRLDAVWKDVPVRIVTRLVDGRTMVELNNPQTHQIEPLNATLVDVNVFQMLVRDEDLTPTHRYRDVLYEA